MSVGIIIVAHGDVGDALVRAAEFILADSLARIRIVPFLQSDGDSTPAEDISAAVADADHGDGVLVLTDLIGASPSNLALENTIDHEAVMVTGLNLAMLVSVWNYRDRPPSSIVSACTRAPQPAS
jgi:PTS system ascorbate-specific IIA component